MPRDLNILAEGSMLAPTEADVTLAFAAIMPEHPQAADVLRRALAAREVEGFSVRLLREVVEHLERSTAARDDVAERLKDWLPLIKQVVDLLEARLAEERRVKRRQEEAEEVGRSTALEHARGVWTFAIAVAKHPAVLPGLFSLLGSGATWLAMRFLGGTP